MKLIMNAKQMLLLVVAALVLLSTPAAQAFYNPHTGRWLSRDPASEIGADTLYEFGEQDLVDEYGDSNLYRFVVNDPISLVDRFGLAVAEPPPAGTSGCACECKSLKITFSPGGDKFDPGFYQLGEDSRFGIVIMAAWTVDGDPAQCKYFAKEPDGGLTKIEGPKGKIPDSTGTPGGDWFPVPQVWYDATGFDMQGPGKYQIKYNLTQSYKCVSADQTEMVVGPKHYKKKVKKTWPQK